VTSCGPGSSNAPVTASNVYTNDHYLPGVGYYHAPFRSWYAHRYNEYSADNKGCFHGGQWNAAPHHSITNVSSPAAEAAQQAEARRASTSRGGFREHLTPPFHVVLMHRHRLNPRPDWRAKVEDIGFNYHTHDGGPYWDESACYELTAAEVGELESAGNALHPLCIAAAEAVIEKKLVASSRYPIHRHSEHSPLMGAGRFGPAGDPCDRQIALGHFQRPPA